MGQGLTCDNLAIDSCKEEWFWINPGLASDNDLGFYACKSYTNSAEGVEAIPDNLTNSVRWRVYNLKEAHTFQVISSSYLTSKIQKSVNLEEL